MIIFDTETTGLPSIDTTPLIQQPYIIEFGAIKIEDGLVGTHRTCFGQSIITDALHFRCRVPVKLSDKIQKITHLSDAILVKEDPFYIHFEKIIRFFENEKNIVAHHLAFDKQMIEIECQRNNVQLNWPQNLWCSSEEFLFKFGYRISLKDLFFTLLKKKTSHKLHSAMGDVYTLAQVLCESELIKIRS